MIKSATNKKLRLSLILISYLSTISFSLPFQNITDPSIPSAAPLPLHKRLVYTNSTSLPLSKINLIKSVLNNQANERYAVLFFYFFTYYFYYPHLILTIHYSLHFIQLQRMEQTAGKLELTCKH